MKHSEAAAARGRLEAWLESGDGPTDSVLNDASAVCAWTRHWEHACQELDDMLAADRARAARLKVYTPDDDDPELAAWFNTLYTALVEIAEHDPLNVSADTAKSRFYNAYLWVKDIAHNAIGLTGDEIRAKYTPDNGQEARK